MFSRALRRIQGRVLADHHERARTDRRARSVWLASALPGQTRRRLYSRIETCALDLIHAEFVREIEPGEVFIIDENGLRSEGRSRMSSQRSACSNTSISRDRTA